MDKSKLHDFVKHYINDDAKASEAAFHDFLKGKMREIINNNKQQTQDKNDTE